MRCGLQYVGQNAVITPGTGPPPKYLAECARVVISGPDSPLIGQCRRCNPRAEREILSALSFPPIAHSSGGSRVPPSIAVARSQSRSNCAGCSQASPTPHRCRSSRARHRRLEAAGAADPSGCPARGDKGGQLPGTPPASLGRVQRARPPRRRALPARAGAHPPAGRRRMGPWQPPLAGGALANRSGDPCPGTCEGSPVPARRADAGRSVTHARPYVGLAVALRSIGSRTAGLQTDSRRPSKFRPLSGGSGGRLVFKVE
jgi:hypothetical protein